MDQSRESTEPQEEENQDDDIGLREQLELALDGDEGVEGGDADPGESTDTVAEKTAEGEIARPPQDAQQPADEGTGQKPSGASKPPIDWGPELREKWGDLSPDVQAKIAERESQIAQAMQGTAQARKVAQDFSTVAGQYGSVMAAEGVQNPLQMFDNVMRTVSELRMGTPTQKANKLAELIQNYGVDVATLDSALAARLGGQPQPQGQPQADPGVQALLDERLAPVNDMMQRLAMMEQQKQQRGVQEAQMTVDQFAASPEGEFLNDVRHDVADLIDLATRQGREMSLKEAYDKACLMNPQIASVLQQREQQKRLAEAGQGIASKRNAGSSLKPGNLGGGNPNPNDSLYDAISSAWDEQVGR